MNNSWNLLQLYSVNVSFNWVKGRIRDESANTTNLLGCPVVNYLDKKVKWHKITEFKWLTPWKIGKSKEFDEHTIAIYKYYKEWEIGAEPIDLIRDTSIIKDSEVDLEIRKTGIVIYERQKFNKNSWIL